MRLPLASAALALAVASAALAAPVANQWGLSLVSLSGGGISEIVTGSFTTDAAGGIIDWDLLATGDFMLGFSSVDGSLDASSASGFSLLDGSGSSLTVSFGAALDGVISPDQVSTASAVLSGTVVAGGASLSGITGQAGIPEPASLLVLAAGLLGLACLGRRAV